MKKKTNSFSCYLSRIGRAVKTLLLMLFFGIIIVTFLTGSTITLSYNPDKVKETIIDKIKKGITVAKTVNDIIK